MISHHEEQPAAVSGSGPPAAPQSRRTAVNIRYNNICSRSVCVCVLVCARVTAPHALPTDDRSAAAGPHLVRVFSSAPGDVTCTGGAGAGDRSARDIRCVAGVRPPARYRRVRFGPAGRAPVIGRAKAANGRTFSNRADTCNGDRVTGRGPRTRFGRHTLR